MNFCCISMYYVLCVFYSYNNYLVLSAHSIQILYVIIFYDILLFLFRHVFYDITFFYSNPNTKYHTKELHFHFKRNF